MFEKYGPVTDVEIIFNERGSKVIVAFFIETKKKKVREGKYSLSD